MNLAAAEALRVEEALTPLFQMADALQSSDTPPLLLLPARLVALVVVKIVEISFRSYCIS